MRALVLLSLAGLALSACGTTPGPYRGPLPSDGPILYSCEDGTQLTVEFEGGEARVAIIGGRSFVLPSVGADAYSNGRSSLRGGGREAQWQTDSRAPVSCRGG